MKKTLATLAMTTMTVAFAQELNFPLDTKVQSTDTIYMKIGANESDIPKNDETVMPGLGIGYRTAFDHHAVDVSVEGNARQIRNIAQEKVTNYSYALPVKYLYIVNPKSNNSLYAGAGLAIGGIQQTTVIAAADEVLNEDGTIATASVIAEDKFQEFHGFIPNVTVGYEFNRMGAVKTFVQLDVSQPALAVTKSGDFMTPKFALSAGIGF